MAAFASTITNLNAKGEPEEISIQLVTTNLFSVLGVRPMLGHAFSPDDGVDENRRVVILSYGLWQRRFALDPGILGNQILLNGRPTTVIGIMPAEFQWFIKEGSFTGKIPELWAPYAITPEVRTRKGRYLTTIARLKPGMSVSEAKAQMKLLSQRLESQFHDFNAGWNSNVVSLREQLSGDLRKPLWILAGAVGFVLLIACTNVANIMLSRAVTRGREVAVRTALGAGRGRIVRQLLTESVLLSVLGGAAGLLLAVWGTRALELLGTRAGIHFGDIQLNLPVVLFTFGISVLTGIFFGLAPAVIASGWNLNHQLKEGGRGTVGHGGKIRNILVVGEVAFALILLAGAGLLIQSFWRLTAVYPGFNPDQILTFRILLTPTKYQEPAKRTAWFNTLVEQLKAMPAVKSAGVVSFLPFAGLPSGTIFEVVGRPKPAEGQEPTTQVFTTDDGFFQTLQIPLKRGRLFHRSEMTEAKHVVVINESLARKYFPNEDPMGKRLIIWMSDNPAPCEIIGIVGDAKQTRLETDASPSVYWPHPELPLLFMNAVVRTEGDPLSLVPSVTGIVRRLDPDQPLANIRLLQDWLGDSTAKAEFNMTLLAILACVALLLATAGVYGVMSHAVAQRTHEIGIRMALGATASNVLSLILKNGSLLILTGAAIGCVLTLGITRLMKSMLYETSTTDPMVFLLVTLLLGLAGFLACWVPSRRAAHVDPLVALRYE